MSPNGGESLLTLSYQGSWWHLGVSLNTLSFASALQISGGVEGFSVKRKLKRTILTVGLMVCLAIHAGAQENKALFVGTVRAQSGSLLEGAVVILEAASSETSHIVETDVQGHYEAMGMEPGTYEITVPRSGFLAQVREGIELPAEIKLEVDFVLVAQAGSSGSGSSEGSTSTSTQQPAQRSTSHVDVIDQSQLVGLPLNGRSYTELATLEAGVSGSSGASGGGGSINISGGRGEWNSFLMDGTDINDADNQVPRSAAGGQLGSDAVLQVQVVSSNYGAQYGRAAGGVVNAITRSGSDEWHGTVFEFLRNSKLDARGVFDPMSEPPPFKRNQFGGILTGPVVKEKIFFMAGTEILRNRLSQTFTTFVPDNFVRQESVLLPGRNTPITVHPSVLPYLRFYPEAQIPVLDRQTGQPTGVAENRTEGRQPTDEYFFVGRIDHRVGDRDAWFSRYTFDDASRVSVGTQPRFKTLTQSRQQYLTLTETHFFSPALINTVRLGYTRPVANLEITYQVEVPRSLFFFPQAHQMGTTNVTGLSVFGPVGELPSGKVMNSYQFSDELIYSHRGHTWYFGGLVERFQWNVFNHQRLAGRWAFSSLENFLLGGPTGTTLEVALPGSSTDRAYRQSLLGFHIQDDYRIRPGLTLNLGLRYEFTTMIHDTRSRTAHLADEFLDTAPQQGPLMSRNPSLRNFAPRLGVSWSPGTSNKTVLRAGFGIYHDQIIEYSVDNTRNTSPFFQMAFQTNVDARPYFPDAVAAGRNFVANRLRIFEYHNPKTPTAYRYNFSLQRELFSGLNLQVAYVGARGNHLLRSFEANLQPFPIRQQDGSLYFPPDPDWVKPDGSIYSPSDPKAPKTPPDNSMNPAFGSIQKTLTDAQSFFNSFYISINRSSWHGLSLGGNYTFSKSVDDSSSVGDGMEGYGLERTTNRAVSSFHNPHRFSMNSFYNLPWGASRPWLQSGWLSAILGNWRIGGILSIRAGGSASVNDGLPTPGFLYVPDRPNLLPGRSNNPIEGVSSGCAGIPAGSQLGGVDLYFDPCAFGVPAPGTHGNLGPRTLRGPGLINMDMSFQKQFALDSKRSLQFRAEFFNIANHPSFSSPSDPQIFRDTTGRINPSASKLRSMSNEPRQIQFALRLSF